MERERHLNDARRYHSLDAVRAVALLLGIVVHATVSFWPGFRDAHYPVSDDYPSATLSGLYFVLHIFRIAGVAHALDADDALAAALEHRVHPDRRPDYRHHVHDVPPARALHVRRRVPQWAQEIRRMELDGGGTR
jgi:hypothetical protein